ncbi:MAG: hypothetical protein Q7K25_01415 [Actinomycetota bacterium]|nr:hypothetical protein [Actinomycetota bacterium]
MEAVRRPEDGELCGFISGEGQTWTPRAIFGGPLAKPTDRASAEELVRSTGLAALSEHWNYRESPAADWEPALIIEANPQSVTLALGYYSLPGVPTVTLSSELIVAQQLLRRGKD